MPLKEKFFILFFLTLILKKITSHFKNIGQFLLTGKPKEYIIWISIIVLGMLCFDEIKVLKEMNNRFVV